MIWWSPFRIFTFLNNKNEFNSIEFWCDYFANSDINNELNSIELIDEMNECRDELWERHPILRSSFIFSYSIRRNADGSSLLPQNDHCKLHPNLHNRYPIMRGLIMHLMIEMLQCCRIVWGCRARAQRRRRQRHWPTRPISTPAPSISIQVISISFAYFNISPFLRKSQLIHSWIHFMNELFNC